jgi:MATE family multidrug resistance protein
VAALAANLLKFIALYSLFDTANVVFAAAIKGAGDTRFALWASLSLSWGLMVVPSVVVLRFLGGTLYHLWAFATLYIVVIGVVFFARFLGGKWKSFRVIEPRLMEREIARP